MPVQRRPLTFAPYEEQDTQYTPLPPYQQTVDDQQQPPTDYTQPPAAAPGASTQPTPPPAPPIGTYAPPKYAPEGFDQAKWASDWSSPKYQFGRAWGGDASRIGDAAKLIGATVLDPQRIKLADGWVIDLYRNYSTEGTAHPQWLVDGGGASGAGSPGGWQTQPYPMSGNAGVPGFAGGFYDPATGTWSQGTGGGGTPAQSGGGDFAALQSLLGGAGMGGNVGQDAFSQLLTGGFKNLIDSGGKGPNASSQQQARVIEAARMPYEIARKSQLNNARAELADRGLLTEPGQPAGEEVNAIGRIEQGLAPAYTGAINDRLQQLDQLQQEQARTYLDTLIGGTQRQTALSTIALQALDQNRLWNQFLADFGLRRDQVLHDMANGDMAQYLELLRIWLAAAGLSTEGFV